MKMDTHKIKNCEVLRGLRPFILVYINIFQETRFSIVRHLYTHPLKSPASMRARTRQY